MKDSRCAEEFVSAAPILTGRIRMLDVLASFGQKMSAIFSRTIWPKAHSELPRPIFQIRPRMYVRRTIMYEIAAFCSPEEHA